MIRIKPKHPVPTFVPPEQRFAIGTIHNARIRFLSPAGASVVLGGAKIGLLRAATAAGLRPGTIVKARIVAQNGPEFVLDPVIAEESTHPVFKKKVGDFYLLEKNYFGGEIDGLIPERFADACVTPQGGLRIEVSEWTHRHLGQNFIIVLPAGLIDLIYAVHQEHSLEVTLTKIVPGPQTKNYSCWQVAHPLFPLVSLGTCIVNDGLGLKKGDRTCFKVGPESTDATALLPYFFEGTLRFSHQSILVPVSGTVYQIASDKVQLNTKGGVSVMVPRCLLPDCSMGERISILLFKSSIYGDKIIGCPDDQQRELEALTDLLSSPEASAQITADQARSSFFGNRFSYRATVSTGIVFPCSVETTKVLRKGDSIRVKLHSSLALSIDPFFSKETRFGILLDLLVFSEITLVPTEDG